MYIPRLTNIGWNSLVTIRKKDSTTGKRLVLELEVSSSIGYVYISSIHSSYDLTLRSKNRWGGGAHFGDAHSKVELRYIAPKILFRVVEIHKQTTPALRPNVFRMFMGIKMVFSVGEDR